MEGFGQVRDGFETSSRRNKTLFAASVVAVVAAATPYLRVRAFAVPAVLFCTSAQGGCLGQQDARTPLVIFIVAGVINAFGDFWAVQSWGLVTNTHKSTHTPG